MAKRKPTTTAELPTREEHPTPEGPVMTHTNDVERAFAESGIDGSHANPDAMAAAPSNGNGTRRRPVRGTFTSSVAGVHAVEDKRFNLPRVGIDFDDDKRATEQEKDELKAAGFRYDPRDKGYTAIANPDTRAARDTLAQSFTERRLKEQSEQGEGQSR